MNPFQIRIRLQFYKYVKRDDTLKNISYGAQIFKLITTWK